MTGSRHVMLAVGRQSRIKSVPTHEVKSLATLSAAACPETIDSQSLICLASLISAVTPAQVCIPLSSYTDQLFPRLLQDRLGV